MRVRVFDRDGNVSDKDVPVGTKLSAIVNLSRDAVVLNDRQVPSGSDPELTDGCEIEYLRKSHKPGSVGFGYDGGACCGAPSMRDTGKRERCRRYREYVILAQGDDPEVVGVVTRPGYDELAVNRGQSGRGEENFDAVVREARESAKNVSDDGVLEVWGIPYPANGGMDPNGVRLFELTREDVTPAVCPGDELVERLLEDGPVTL